MSDSNVFHKCANPPGMNSKTYEGAVGAATSRSWSYLLLANKLLVVHVKQDQNYSEDFKKDLLAQLRFV